MVFLVESTKSINPIQLFESPENLTPLEENSFNFENLRNSLRQ
jgi:hypothetical protein